MNLSEKSKKFFSYLFRILFTLGIFALILYGFQKKMGGNQNILSEILYNFQRIHLGWFFLATVIFIASSLLGALRIRLMTRSHQIDIPFLRHLRYIYIGYFFNPILMGSTGGDVVRSYYLTKETGKKTEIVTVVFLDRFVGISVLVFIALLAIGFNIGEEKIRSLFFGTGLLFLVLIGTAGLLSSRRVVQNLSFFSRFFPNNRLKKIFKNALNTLNQTKQYKGTLLKAAFLTFIFQSSAILSCWVVSHSLTVIDPIPLKYFFLFLPIVFTLSAIPISLGGLGVGEAIFAGLFSLVGVPEADAISIALLNRLILLFTAFLGGIVYLTPSTPRYSSPEIK